MTPKTRRSEAAAHTRSAPEDEWARLVSELAAAPAGPEREQAFVRFTAAVSDEMAGIGRHRESLLALMRSALASEGVVADLSGDPRIMVDEVALPHFDAQDVIVESALRGRVRAAVLDAELLTAAAVSALVGSESKNPRQYANRLRLASRIVGVPHRNQYLYPAFQFDVERGAVWEAAARVNVLLRAAQDPWGVASWWLAPNGRLGGRAPHALLGDHAREETLVMLASSLAEDDAA